MFFTQKRLRARQIFLKRAPIVYRKLTKWHLQYDTETKQVTGTQFNKHYMEHKLYLNLFLEIIVRVLDVGLELFNHI